MCFRDPASPLLPPSLNQKWGKPPPPLQVCSTYSKHIDIKQPVLWYCDFWVTKRWAIPPAPVGRQPPAQRGDTTTTTLNCTVKHTKSTSWKRVGRRAFASVQSHSLQTGGLFRYKLAKGRENPPNREKSSPESGEKTPSNGEGKTPKATPPEVVINPPRKQADKHLPNPPTPPPSLAGKTSPLWRKNPPGGGCHLNWGGGGLPYHW